MLHLQPAIREIRRVARRWQTTRRMRAADKALEAAETQLGLLGWQQAEYDTATQQHTRQLEDVERKQAELTNATARLGRELATLKQERARAAEALAGELKEVQAEVEIARQPLIELEQKISALRKQETEFSTQLPALEREQRELEELIKTLSLRVLTENERKDLSKCRERVLRIPNQRAEMRTSHLRLVSELKRLEASAGEIQQQVQQVEKRGDELRSKYGTIDATLAEKLGLKEKERLYLDREIESLESAKKDPYREIGRALADGGIAPVNQPQVLKEVKSARSEVERVRQMLRSLQEESAAENPEEVRRGLIVLAMIALAQIALVYWLLNY